MASTLADLLGADEPAFSLALRRLESESGHASVDVQLIAEIKQKTTQKIKELGLDARDTTGKELYYALINMVKLHDNHLARALGGQDPADVADMTARIIQKVEDLDLPRTCWSLKPSAAKRLLQAMAPKRTMKYLGYRSLESMLKRENLAEIFGAVRFAESPRWTKDFLHQYHKLSAADFQASKVRIIHMDRKKWGKLSQQYVAGGRHNITHLKELGVILVLPFPLKRLPGISVTLLPLLVHYINEIRMYSAYFKLQQVKPDFGDIVARTLESDPASAATMAGTPLHWRAIQRHWGRQDASQHPEVFEPHVQAEDLHWRKAEEVLYRIEPSLSFWRDLDWVGAQYGNHTVSFSLMDNALSYLNELPYPNGAVHNLRSNLWNELLTRYLGKEALEEQVLGQLDQEMLSRKTAVA